MSNFDKGFTGVNVDVVRFIMQKHLNAAAKELGISPIMMGGITYDKNSFTTKCTANLKEKVVAEVSIDNKVGKIFRPPTSPTKYVYMGEKEGKIRIRTDRRGGKSWLVNKDEFVNWIMVE